jgi:hypothetical protein
MEQSHCRETDSHSASQEIARLSWNPKVQNCVHRNPYITQRIRHPPQKSERSENEVGVTDTRYSSAYLQIPKTLSETVPLCQA